MNPATTRTFWRDPVGILPTPKLGTMLRVELAQRVGDSWGPHVVGQAEVFEGGKLKLSITTVSQAGRDAVAFLADDILDAELWGSKPVVRLR